MSRQRQSARRHGVYRPGARRADYLANNSPGSAKALNSSALPQGVEEEHRRLLAHQPLEAHMRLDHETRAGGTQPLGQRLPFGHRKHQAEVPHGHIVAVHPASMPMTGLLGGQMRHDLVAMEIEVHPAVRRAPLGATQQAAIEGACLGQRGHRKGQMKGVWNAHGLGSESLDKRPLCGVAPGAGGRHRAQRLSRSRWACAWPARWPEGSAPRPARGRAGVPRPTTARR